MTGGILLCFSILGLLHAAFSSYENLSTLKAAGTPAQLPPIDVMAEAILSLLMFTVGAVLYAPPLKPNTWASEMAHRTIDQMDSRLGFVTFNHRGRFLPGKRTS